jgi:Domain of unknown function (DUF4340)
MRWKKEHIILLGIIIFLAAYLVIQKSGRTHYVLPPVARIVPKEITKLLIKNRDSVITLTRKGAGWAIEPQGYPADQGIVEGLAEDVAGLTLTALASEGGNEAVYELNDGNRIETDAYKGDMLVRELKIGKTAGGHTFVELDRNAGIFHADHDLRMAFDKTISDLRDKAIMNVDGEITELTLTKGKKTLSIEKALLPASSKEKMEQGKGPEQQRTASYWKIAGKKPANDAEVDDLISTLSHLTCDGFIEGKVKKDFHSPVYTVSLKGAKTYNLSIFNEKDKSYAAVSSESPYPFNLSEWKTRKIMKDFASLVAQR